MITKEFTFTFQTLWHLSQSGSSCLESHEAADVGKGKNCLQQAVEVLTLDLEDTRHANAHGATTSKSGVL